MYHQLAADTFKPVLSCGNFCETGPAIHLVVVFARSRVKVLIRNIISQEWIS